MARTHQSGAFAQGRSAQTGARRSRRLSRRSRRACKLGEPLAEGLARTAAADLETRDGKLLLTTSIAAAPAEAVLLDKDPAGSGGRFRPLQCEIQAGLLH